MNNKSTAAVIAHFARLEYEFWQNNFLRFIDCENTDLAKALNGFVAPLTGKGSKLFLRFDLVEGSGVPSPEAVRFGDAFEAAFAEFFRKSLAPFHSGAEVGASWIVFDGNMKVTIVAG